LIWLKPLKYPGEIFFSRYHAKVLSFSIVKKIINLQYDIREVSEKNKKIIPFKYAYKIIFEESDYIAVMDCPCKLSSNAPKETINSCIAVGKDLASFWMEHCSKYNARKIEREEAIEIISNLRSKGHITQAFFKVATGGSTGVICNCHPDTCASLTASKLTDKIFQGLKQSAVSGYSIVRDEEKYNSDKCYGCGLCVDNCSSKAIAQIHNSNLPEPLDIEKLNLDE
jgi:NAD-dependent dihydropyrimidine dehydrogenase PreA subunit